MADPTKYEKGYDYSAWQASNPTKPLPAEEVDNDLSNVETSIDEIVDAVKDIRRSDGALQNGIVTRAALSSEVTIGLPTPTPWASGVLYTIDLDSVTYMGRLYICAVTHVSGLTFEDDNWSLVADFTEGFEVADGSITNAKLADGSVSADKIIDGNITAIKLASNAVQTAKIADGAVTSAKLAAAVWNRILDTYTQAEIAALLAALAAADIDVSPAIASQTNVQSALSNIDGRVTTIENGRAGDTALITTLTASSSATLDFTTAAAFNGTYRKLIFELDNILAASSGTTLYCRFSQGGVWQTSGYIFGIFGSTTTNSSASGTGNNSNGFIALNNEALGNANASNALVGEFTVLRPNGSIRKTIEGWLSYFTNASTQRHERAGGSLLSTSAIDGVRFYMSSGNIASGTIRMYGVRA